MGSRIATDSERALHPPASPSSRPGTANDDERRAVSVLIVEDDPDACFMMAELLTRAGHTVAIAHDGREALALLRSVTPRLILLDVCMPIMDGAAFREAQRRDRALLEIPTIVMTGADVEPMLDLAVEETLRKPVRSLELLEIVNRHCPPGAPGPAARPRPLASSTTTASGPTRKRPTRLAVRVLGLVALSLWMILRRRHVRPRGRIERHVG